MKNYLKILFSSNFNTLPYEFSGDFLTLDLKTFLDEKYSFTPEVYQKGKLFIKLSQTTETGLILSFWNHPNGILMGIENKNMYPYKVAETFDQMFTTRMLYNDLTENSPSMKTIIPKR